MATNRTPLQRTGLALNHEQEMSLRYGELASHFAFASEEERREAWFYHRDRLLQHCSGGQRPAGWWDYECPIRRPRDRDYEEAASLEAGLLTEDEGLIAPQQRNAAATRRAGFRRKGLGHVAISNFSQGNGEPSAIDLPEHDVERADDCRNIGQHMPAA